MDSSDRAGRQAPVTKNADADGNADQHREREQRKRQGEHQNILIKATVLRFICAGSGPHQSATGSMHSSVSFLTLLTARLTA